MRPLTYLLASAALVTILPCQLVASVNGHSWISSALAQSSGAQVGAPQSTATPAVNPPDSPEADATKKAKSKKGKRLVKGDDFSGSRDLNLFQVEPTVLNERYYTSGKSEHSQKMSPTLPYGAPIPDNEGPYAPEKPAQTGSIEKLNDKLDSEVKAKVVALKNITGDSATLKLKLRVSAIDAKLLSSLRDLKADVVSSEKASGDMVIYAPVTKVNDIGGLHQVLVVMLAQ